MKRRVRSLGGSFQSSPEARSGGGAGSPSSAGSDGRLRAPTRRRCGDSSPCLLPLLAALALLSGCSTVDPSRLDAGEELEALGAAWGDALGEHRLLIAAPAEPLPYAMSGDEETLRAPARFEPPALGSELEAALGAIAPPGGRQARVALAEHPDTAAEQAWDQGYDLLVRVVPRRWEVTYLRRNGWWWPNALFLGWYFWPVGPQWWLADEEYGVDLELELSVVDVASGKALPGLEATSLVVRSPREPPEQPPTPVEVLHPPRLALDDLDRGLDLFGTWVAGLEPDQWEQVAGHLAPFARRAAAVRVAAKVAEGVSRFDRLSPEERGRHLSTVHALVVGVSSYEDECVGADADATAVQALLRGEGGAAWAPDKNLQLLANAQVGRRPLHAAVRRLAERARPADTLVVYFAGRGTRRRGAGLHGFGLLVPPDERGPRSGVVTLGELAEWLRAVPAQRRLLVLDADFQPGPRGPAAAGAPVDEDALKRLLRGGFLPAGTQGAVVLASRLLEGERVQTYEGQGLLTRYLLQALQGDADEGKDGLTPRDLATYLAERVGNLSEVALGAPQHPLVVSPSPEAPLR